MNRPDCLYIVIPCYNEEQVLPVTSGMFLDELNHLIKASKISSDRNGSVNNAFVK